MKKTIATLMLIGALSISGPAFAAASCFGTISQVKTEDDGAVLIYSSWRTAYTQVCNLKDNWKGIDPQTCWGWFAHSSTALTENLAVRVYYAALASGDCPTLDTGSLSPAPTYIILH
ncbi:hypothetical protein [Parasphingorhabdus sp.]|uniref:hypothetical protein n=1 Tax=Parasphingorhabdus sp. TaxID=2709688 RepID=UPI003262E5E9